MRRRRVRVARAWRMYLTVVPVTMVRDAAQR